MVVMDTTTILMGTPTLILMLIPTTNPTRPGQATTTMGKEEDTVIITTTTTMGLRLVVPVSPECAAPVACSKCVCADHPLFKHFLLLF
jgi:hypothetical protein